MTIPVFLIILSVQLVGGTIIVKPPLDKHWLEYKRKYNLHFSEDEDSVRRNIFTKNSLYIKQKNAENALFSLEINRFAHLNDSEIPRCIVLPPGLGNRSRGILKYAGDAERRIPATVDWRTYGLVSPVKDQGHCGSCYAFAAVGAMESHFAKLTGRMTLLSEQQIVDCSGSYGDHGCGGGLMEYVFSYATENSMLKEDEYPYQARENICVSAHTSGQFRLLGYQTLPTGDEAALRRALAFSGPVAIAIRANTLQFRFYKEGILYIPDCGSSPEDLDHGVLAVGYGSEPEPHIIVKNSWGSDYGENGYVRMALFRNNNCGIATMPSIPIPRT